MSKNDNIGKRIKDRRKGLGISQMDMAYALSINQSNVSRIENGTHLPTIDQLRMLKDLLSVDYEYLIEGKQPEKKSEKDRK
jgi:transcriptional regulator with XRE-family HTH domain